MKHFFAALQFLTILPVRIKTQVTERDLGRALAYFPIAGSIIGFCLALVSLIFGFLSREISIVMVLIASAVLTGAIHLDGFADVCDGFFGAKDKEKVLNIMRDSRIGAFGVIGLVCLFLLKFVLLLKIPQNMLAGSLIVMVMFARWIQVFACFNFDYARNQGKAKGFMAGAGKKGLTIAAGFLIIAALGLMGVKGIVILGFSSLPAIFFMFYAKKRIGGMTGDTIGASSEIAEVSFLLFFIVWLKLHGIFLFIM